MTPPLLTGSICGDVIGSAYEFHNTRDYDFLLIGDNSTFTDDTVLTVATMDCLLKGEQDYCYYYKEYPRLYPNRGYGGLFRKWVRAQESGPYNSFGNGSAMRISPVGWAFETLEETLAEAQRSAEVTHNHPEGIKGAQAIAAAIFLARTGHTKAQIREYIETTFSYDLHRTCDEIRPAYCFNATCQGSVPEALTAFLESHDFESAIRLAVSIGGDSDTIACMAGGIAQAFYRNIPPEISERVWQKLPEQMQEVIRKFSERYLQENKN